MSEFDKLVAMLLEYEIPFKVYSMHDGHTLTVDSIPDFDVICHSGSYGGPEGFIEIMGLTTPMEKRMGGTVGWLRAEKVLVRILKALNIPYKKSKSNELHATWNIEYGSTLSDGTIEVKIICSNCKGYGSVFDKFCSHCGAKMDK